jgi:hypothetical protein
MNTTARLEELKRDLAEATGRSSRFRRSCCGIQHMLKRQGMRAAFELIAAVFAVGLLVLSNVAG